MLCATGEAARQPLGKIVSSKNNRSGDRCTGVVPDGQNLQRVVVDRGETPRIAKSAE